MVSQVIAGDLWDYHSKKKGHYVVVPTNTTTNKRGHAVMGRGIAAQASKKFPKLARQYGKRLRKDKTVNGFCVFKKLRLIMFPIKRHYKDDANLALIENSLKNLKLTLLFDKSIKKVFLPMVGCGFGNLLYEQVLPLLLTDIFDNMTIVIPPNKLYSKDKYRESFLPGRSGKKDRRVGLSNCYSDIEV